MNNERRKKIESIKNRFQSLIAEAEEIKNEVQEVLNEEQEYRDNMPESFADGEKGNKADEAIGALEEVIDWLDEIVGLDYEDSLETAAA